MKINRDMVTQAALKLLNEQGLEQLTLRLLAKELKIQAPTVYWHFKSKEDLTDEMASVVLAEGAAHLLPPRASAGWQTWVTSFGTGLRKTFMQYRDGARMIAGSRLTNTAYMKTAEGVAAKLLESGFTIRQAVVLLSTIYNYTQSFAMEEQAVYPYPQERSPKYDPKERLAKLDPKELPILRRSGPILFGGFDRRFREGLEMIVRGANAQRTSK